MKRALIAILLVIAVLSPVAQLLRTQNPWKCFPLTSDESFFTQAIYNWSDGKGFRVHSGGVLDPNITVGPPMAWGSHLVHEWTGLDWPQAGRLFVHICFYSILFLIAFFTRRKSGSWASGVFAAGVFGYCISQAPSGPYLIYGILGEIPGALAAWFSLVLLSAGAWISAGAMAVFAFFIKPSYALFVPALCLTALIFYRARGLITCVSAGVFTLLTLFWIAAQREQSLKEYVELFTKTAVGISPTTSESQLSVLAQMLQPTGLAISVAILILGLIGFLGYRKRNSIGFRAIPFTAAELGAWIFFVFGVIYFVVLSKKPMTKHLFLFFSVGSGLLAVRVGIWMGELTNRVLLSKTIEIVSLAVMITWLVNIPGLEKRRFDQAVVEVCPVKEQRHIDRMLKTIGSRDVAVLDGAIAGSFLYEIGWEPKFFANYQAIPKPFPRWIAGEKEKIFPLPSTCSLKWGGSQMALVECSRK